MSWVSNLFPEGHKTEVSTTTKEARKVEELSYIDTLRIRHGSGDMEKLSGVTQEAAPEITRKEKPANPLIEVVSMGFLGKGKSTKTETYDSGWSIADSWMETKWDHMRYAIGIRDLRAFSYRFARYSSDVSIPFRTPKPIRKVTLLTDELIPREFNAGQQIRPWILYWLTFDDGTNWYPISPTAPSVVNMLDGNVLPIAINVNSGIPEEEQDPMQGYVDGEETQQVRLRWRIERPADMSDRTPVLKSYRLQISVEGGL